MRSLASVLCGLALAAGLAAPPAEAQAPPDVPTIKAVLDGKRVAVFVTPRDSCSSNDTPDAMARAFRDAAGDIHFSTASSVLYESVGPTLDQLRHSCKPAFTSANDPDPAHYNDQVWIDSFYTFDGKTIAGLSHTEYHGWAIPGECFNSQDATTVCEYDSDTYHLSIDGGYHFRSFEAPANYVAGFPYKYEIDNGPMGYSVDSNIIAYGGWFYAIATDWQWPSGCTQQPGPHLCRVPLGGTPIRTTNVFDPASWRAWNGAQFSLSFVDPYLGPVAHPAAHVYTPIQNMQFVMGLNVYAPANIVVATLWDYWDNQLGPPGLYFTTSSDLVHWTTPRLVVTLADILEHDPKGNWLYTYFSLIDPDAPDRSFSIIGRHPYLYYVRIDNNSSGRILFRQRLDLTAEP